MNDSYLSSLASSLARLVEGGGMPAEIVGDLADLLGTSHKLCALLEDLGKEGEQWAPAQLKAKLFQIQIIIEQDLPMIVDDLLPPLRTLSGESLERVPPAGVT